MSQLVRALALGDVVGQPGCRALFFELPGLRKRLKADIVVVNGENADDGFGITPEIVTKFYQAGVDVITSGNHIWQKRDIDPLLKKDNRLLRPANYPSGVIGHGWTVLELKGIRWGVINLMGRDRMPSVDCPFRTARDILQKHGSEADLWLIDFHAESPMEKEALAFTLDGKASLLWGTHTHVQTDDARVFPAGLGFVTDLGMTGPVNSVIGSQPEISLRRSQTQLPLRMEVEEGEAMINGLLSTIDLDSGRVQELRLFNTARDEI